MDVSVRTGLQRPAPSQWHPICHAHWNGIVVLIENALSAVKRFMKALSADIRNAGRGSIRNWEVTGSVSLNPGKMKEVERNKKAA